MKPHLTKVSASLIARFIYTLAVLFILMIIPNKAQSQNALQTSLQWSSTSVSNQADNSTFNLTSRFVTGNNTLNWDQANGRKIITYTVTSVDGQWTDVAADGQITFNVQYGAVTGTYTFLRLSGKTTVRARLFVGEKLDQDYVFNIDSVTIAP